MFQNIFFISRHMYALFDRIRYAGVLRDDPWKSSVTRFGKILNLLLQICMLLGNFSSGGTAWHTASMRLHIVYFTNYVSA